MEQGKEDKLDSKNGTQCTTDGPTENHEDTQNDCYPYEGLFEGVSKCLLERLDLLAMQIDAVNIKATLDDCSPECRRYLKGVDRLNDIQERVRTITQVLPNAPAKPPCHCNYHKFLSRNQLNPVDEHILLVLLDIYHSSIIESQEQFMIPQMTGSDLLTVTRGLAIADEDVKAALAPGTRLTKRRLVFCPGDTSIPFENRIFLLSKEVVDTIHVNPTADPEGIDGPEGHQILNPTAPRFKLDEVVLPDDVKVQVSAMMAQLKHTDLLMTAWGFGKTMKSGKGIIVLLTGPPGTGKTMLSEAVAGELGRKVAFLDFTRILDRNIGFSDRNIQKAFREAAEDDIVLVFDECDAMLTRRMEVTDSCDLFFNRIVNQLLMEIERFEGVVIMTTNRSDALDRGLERRVGFKIFMPRPDAKMREAIWKRHLPPEAPLGKDIAPAVLAIKYELTGSEIRDAVLAAARGALVKMDTDPHADMRITMKDLEAAIERGRKGHTTMRYNLDRDTSRTEKVDVPGYE